VCFACWSCKLLSPPAPHLTLHTTTRYKPITQSASGKRVLIMQEDMSDKLMPTNIRVMDLTRMLCACGYDVTLFARSVYGFADEFRWVDVSSKAGVHVDGALLCLKRVLACVHTHTYSHSYLTCFAILWVNAGNRQELDELGVEWVFPVPREDWKSDFRMKNYMQTKQSEQFDIIIM
jgi:hypothetical protein